MFDIERPQSLVVAAQFVPDRRRKLLQQFVRDRRGLALRNPLEVGNPHFEGFSLGAPVRHALGKDRIACGHLARLDERQQVADRSLTAGVLLLQALQFGLLQLSLFVTGVKDVGQKCSQPGWFKNAFLQLRQHDFIQCFLPDGGASATAAAPIHPGITLVISICTGLAGGDHQGATAAGLAALGQTGQQRRPIGGSWRRHRWRSLGARCRNGGLQVGVYDGRTLDLDRVAAVLDRRVLRAIMIMTGIVFEGKQAVDVGMKPLLPVDAIAGVVDRLGDTARSHWRAACAAQRHRVDQPDNLGFILHDDEAHSLLLSLDAGNLCPIPEWYPSPVPKAPQSILPAAAAGRLCGIAGVFFVHRAHYRSAEPTFFALAGGIRKRDYADPCCLEDVFGFQLIDERSCKSAHRKYNRAIDFVRGVAGKSQHLPERWPIGFCARDPGFGERFDERVPILRGKPMRGLNLRKNGLILSVFFIDGYSAVANQPHDYASLELENVFGEQGCQKSCFARQRRNVRKRCAGALQGLDRHGMS